jgi:hypothetical protein
MQRLATVRTGGYTLLSKIFLFCYALLFLSSVQAIPAAHQPTQETTVYVIRHAEKPDNGSNGLTRKGQLRAECLSKVGSSLIFDNIE